MKVPAPVVEQNRRDEDSIRNTLRHLNARRAGAVDEPIRERMMKVSEDGKGNRRFFAISSLGRTRWYWVVWPSLEELQKARKPLSHIAEGYEKTKADAVEKALGVAGLYAKWIAAKYARAYHRHTRAAATRTGDPPYITEPHHMLASHEFLYREVYDPVTRQWNSVPHRVARRTNRYIFVEQKPYSPDDLTRSWLDGESPTYRLDRHTLEQEGYAFLPASAYVAEHEEPLFFAAERRRAHGGLSPACLKVLNLSWPCTVTDVQEAYRKLVKSAHPDGGGDHDKFLELQAAYEQSLRICL